MVALRNKAPGPRGAWQGLTLVMAEPGEVIEAEDFEPEWFEEVEPEKPAPAPAKGKAKAAPVKPEAEPEE